MKRANEHMKIKYNSFILLFLFSFTALSAANQLNVKVKGDSAAGFYVDLYYGTIPASTQEKVGELNMVVENEDHSIREYVRNWKPQRHFKTGTPSRFRVSFNCPNWKRMYSLK